MTGPVVHPRWARVVGVAWLTAGGALALAGVVVLVDQHRVGWEGPAGAAALAVGWWFWHRSLHVDEHGIEQCVGWRRTRLLWGVVERVVTPPPGHRMPPVRVRLAGRGEVVLQASWGLSSHQRQEVFAALDRAAALNGVAVGPAGDDG